MMNKFTLRTSLLGALLVITSSTLSAQFLGTEPPNELRDVPSIKLPAGSKVAIVVFEDLACPACAHAHPIELEAAKRANVPLLRYDFPIAGHIRTFQGAVCARYIQSKISPSLAEQFRSDIFTAQNSIASKDDLQQFTQVWFQRHGQQMPFVIDPNGSLTKAVEADYNLGLRINVRYTPTVIVVTKDQHKIVCGTGSGRDHPADILPVVEAALAETRITINQPKHIGATR